MDVKLLSLNDIMKEVKDCRLCCEEGQSIQRGCLLKNFISERADGLHYGGAPNLWIDWPSRTHAKIAFIGQDWGTYDGTCGIHQLRQSYERINRDHGDPEGNWLMMRKPMKEDKSTPKMRHFLEESAKLEGLPPLPSNYIDDLYLTNSVLCVRRGVIYSGNINFDAKRSAQNCRKFLLRQLEIVRPLVVVTLGKWAPWSLGFVEENENLAEKIDTVHRQGGYLRANYGGISLAVVPAFHPAARPKDRPDAQQVDDYRYLWKALSHEFRLGREDLLAACFSIVPESTENTEQDVGKHGQNAS